MPVPIPGVVTNRGEGPEGREGGAAEPYTMIAPFIPLCIALPSGRTKMLNHLSWSSTWGPHQSWGQMSSLSFGSQLMSPGRTEKAILPQNPQQKNMKGG